jgi:hypothetical protein
MIGTLVFYWPPERPQYDFEKSRWQEIKEIDYIGFLLYTGGLTIFLIGLTWAGTEGHAWSSASTIAPMVVGILTLIACFIYDFTLAKQPFFPLHLFRQVREFTVLLVVVFVAGKSPAWRFLAMGLTVGRCRVLLLCRTATTRIALHVHE